MDIDVFITMNERLISQAEARRIAKKWGARLPRVGTRLIQSLPILEIKLGIKPKVIFRDDLNRWTIADAIMM